jgi:hypothetical protein
MRILVFYLLLFCSCVTFAQPKPIVLNGIISVNTNETFPYKLVLTESHGIVKGYSLTYKEPYETKTLIQGTLNRHTHTFAFKETEIVYAHDAHDFHPTAYMCLIDAKLDYVPGSGKNYILKGPLTSMEADNTACTGGTITFSNDEEVQYLFGDHEQYDTVITMRKKVPPPVSTDPVQGAPEPSLITDKITAGIEKAYDWHTDTVVIDVWDGGDVDGDRITLQFNGKTYLTGYYLIKEKKQLRIPLGLGVNTITIIADNEGSEPPNTASLLLTDGAVKYSILAYNTTGQKCIIKVKK